MPREPRPVRQFWMVMESPNNWERDAARNFNHYGLTESATATAWHMQKDDILLVYVPAPFKAFAGVRRVSANELQRLDRGGDYDLVCHACVLTSPLVTLPKENWVRIIPLVPHLSFTRRRIQWSVGMRRTIRRLSAEDAALILERMERNAVPREQKRIRLLLSRTKLDAAEQAPPKKVR